MVPGGFTPLDLGLAVIAIVSGLLAMYRGLTREVLSLLSWALAGAAALYFVLYQKPLAQSLADKFFNGTLMLAQAGGGIFIFLVFLIIVHLLTARFSDRVLDSHVGIIDRTLGFAFGLGRGFLLVVIGFVFFTFLTPQSSKFPDWVKDAQSLPLLQQTGAPIQTLMAGLAEYVTNKFGKNGQAQQPAAAPPVDETQGTNG
jgi:membrane protein required for colicin V production